MIENLYSRAQMVHIWLDEEILGLTEGLRLIQDI